MSAAIASVIIPPSQRRWESVLLVVALVALLLFTGFYARTYGIEDKPQVILDWQVSAFSGLPGVDQAIYNELLVAADEIYYLQYYNGYWPADADFQDALLPPFYRDLSWEPATRRSTAAASGGMLIATCLFLTIPNCSR